MEDLPIVKSHKIFESGGKKKFHCDGIFSEQIFGPLVSGQCWCNNVVKEKDKPCPVCGIPFSSSSRRRKQFAKIILPEEVISGKAYILIKKSIICYKMYKHLLSGGSIAISSDKNNPVRILRDNSKIKEGETILFGIEAIEKVIENLYQYHRSKNISALKKLIDNGLFYTKEVIVIPPDLRSVITEGIDEISKCYIQILSSINQLKNKISGEFLKNKYKIILQVSVDNLREAIISKLEGKEGLLRNTSGKRIDWSGRAVIVPVEHGNYIYMPLIMGYEIYKLDLVRKMNENYNVPYIIAIDLINELINNNSEEVYYNDKKIDTKRLMEEILEEEVVIINRQPTLHRGSMFAMKVKLWEHQVIGIPKTICNPTNADFDGDSVVGDIELYNGKGEKVFCGNPLKLVKNYSGEPELWV